MAVVDPNEIMFRAFEPKVQNRFLMFIDGIPSFMIKTAAGPNFTDNAIKLDHLNTYRKIRGKREWGDIDMTLYDPITPSGAQAVLDWARLSYVYKKDLTLQVLGPVGDIVSEWVIKGAFITNMDQGGFDWATDETVELSMTVAMDYCVLNF